MASGITITIVNDEVTPAVHDLINSLSPARLAARIGPAVATLVEKYLGRLGPNKKGWPSTRFYEKFARNVRWTPEPDGPIIGILPALIQGRTVSLRQRVFGGPIRPREARALAIPISPVSYGHVPADFPGLFMIKTPKGAYLVQYGQSVGARTARSSRAKGGNPSRRLNASLNFLFKLSFGVNQDGDRSVLPADQDILQTAVAALVKEPND